MIIKKKRPTYLLLYLLFSIYVVYGQEQLPDFLTSIKITNDTVFNGYVNYIDNHDKYDLPEEVVKKLLDEIHVYAKQKPQEEFLETLYILCNKAGTQQHYLTAVRFCLEYLSYDEVLSQKNAFQIIAILNTCLDVLGLHEESIQWLEKMHELNEKYKLNYWNQNNLYEKNLADVYFYAENYYQAIKNYQLEITIQEKNKDINYIFRVRALNDISKSYMFLGKKDSSLVYMNKALKLLTKNKNEETGYTPEYVIAFEHLVKSNQIPFLIKEKKYGQALQLLRSTKKQIPADTNYNIHLLESYSFKTEIYYNQKKFDKAQEQLTLAFGILDVAPSAKFLTKALTYKEKILLYKKDIEASLIVKQQLKVLSDSLGKRKNKNAMALASYKFNIDRKEADLSKANDLIKSKDKINFYQQIVLGLFVLFGLFFLFFGYKLRKNHQLLSKQKNQITLSLENSELLRKELHHRVKNSLQLISSYWDLQFNTVKDKKTKEVIEIGQKNIRAVALVHKLLYYEGQETVVNMQNYLNKLLSELLTYNPNINLNTEFDKEAIIIGIERAIPIGLIVNELIINSIKHAFSKTDSGQIFISFSKNNDNFSLHYTDSGTPELYNGVINKKESLGLKIIDMLTEELIGTSTLTSKPNFYFKLEF